MIMDHSAHIGIAALESPKAQRVVDARGLLMPFALLAEAAFSHFVARCACPQHYRVFLEQTLFYVSETVPTLSRVAEENPLHPLSQELLNLAREEIGHDGMIHRDLEQLNCPASIIPISPFLIEYVQRARSLPTGMEGVSLLCGDIVAMEGYPPTKAGVEWLAKQFQVSLISCTALLEHVSADAVHGPLAFKRLEHPSIDPMLAIGRAIETLRCFTEHWGWLTAQCGMPPSKSFVRQK
ncbi:MAG: hypothetical protein EAZ42_11365 [Verrucomicrobia bacterium]|nr:MAG: hypothetical protein EAZ42_11365 [Verrucomicrobiota bacterium]